MSVFVAWRMSAFISLRPTLAGAYVTTGPTEQVLASAEGAMPGTFQGQTCSIDEQYPFLHSLASLTTSHFRTYFAHVNGCNTWNVKNYTVRKPSHPPVLARSVPDTRLFCSSSPRGVPDVELGV